MSIIEMQLLNLNQRLTRLLGNGKNIKSQGVINKIQRKIRNLEKRIEE